jgi:HEAT repeat protein
VNNGAAGARLMKAMVQSPGGRSRLAAFPIRHTFSLEQRMMWMLSLTLAAQVATAQAPVERTLPVQEIASAISQAGTDPADSLLRAASARMSRGDYRGAAELYRAAVRRFPTSMRLSEAMYYEAFALYRGGELGQARDVLEVLRDRFPVQAARGDANTLRARICGELARQGDSACAEEVARVSASASTPQVRTGSGTATRRPTASDCPDVDDEDDERVAALNALLQMDAERAMPILTNVLARRDRCSERLRRKAVFLVAQKQTKESANILLAAAKNDPDSEVREQAVFWLAQVRDPRAVEMLVEIVTGNGDRTLRERALFSLSQSTSPAAVTALRTFAENEREPSGLREQAIFSLGQRSGGEQNAYLRGLYSKVTGDELREKVIFALSQRRGMGNESFLLTIANDAKEPIELRKKAIFWAGQMGISIAQLSTLYSTLDDREMREQVIFALSQRREPAALDKLIDVAKSDSDRELRKKAVFWLGQSRDPRATAFLAELINR